MALLLLAGCESQYVPMSAQAGSTIGIPLGGVNSLLPSGIVQAAQNHNEPIGFGGTAYTDYQRGQLVFRLDSTSGTELTTRVTTMVVAHPATPDARGDFYASLSGTQYLSLVDLSSSSGPVPLGTHSVYVSHRYTVNGNTIETPFGTLASDISILPASLDVDIGGGVFQTIVGTQSLFKAYAPNGTEYNADTLLPYAVPDPQIRIALSQSVYAAKVQLHYDPAVINVVDAVPFVGPGGLVESNTSPSVWFNDDGQGTVTVSASARGASFNAIGLVFQLDDGTSQILDVSTVPTPTVQAAYDQNGAPISGVTVGPLQIW